MIGKEYLMAITVRHGSKKSVPLMKALWKEVFHDGDEYIDTFFSTFYKPSKTLLAFENGELVSMLYYMDVNVKYFKKRLKTAYLYGVGTKLSERRQGHFSLLHKALLEELKAKRYEAVMVIPENDALFGVYKDLGYTISLKRFEYKLMTQDIELVKRPEEVWHAKKALHKNSTTGISVLETLPQFLESRRGHRFFSYGSSYLAFAPSDRGWIFYERICPSGEPVPSEQVHYERSALLLDLNGVIDAELVEKQKPELNYLLN